MKEQLKIALVMDNYKIPNKRYWWKQAFKSAQFKKQYPHMDMYILVGEEQHPGVTADTTTFIRYYKLKQKQ